MSHVRKQRSSKGSVLLQMTWSFISKNYLTSLPALRELFFSSATPDADLERFQQILNDQSTPLKLLDLTTLRVRSSSSPLSHPTRTLVGLLARRSA